MSQDVDRGEDPSTTWRSWVLPVVLLVLLAGVVTTSVVLITDRHDAGAAAAQPGVPTPADITAGGVQGSASATSAITVARRAAIAFYSIDHRDLAQSERRLKPLATPGLEADYATQLARLRSGIERRGLVLRARAPSRGTATEYLGLDDARILVSLDVATVAGQGQGRVSHERVRVTLRRSGGGWLTSDLEQVG